MRYFILIYLVGLSMMLSGQDSPPSGEIEDAQIIIEKDKPLTLPKAPRIYQKSQVKPVGSDTVNLSYDLSRPSYSFQTSTYSPTIRSFQSGSEALANKNYLKVGMGNYLSPLLQGFAGYQQDAKSVGLYVFHESFAKGPVRDEESAYGHSSIVLSGGIENEGLKVSPTLSYNREAFYFYGHEGDGDSIFIHDKIGINHIGLNVPLKYVPSERVELSISPQITNTSMGIDGTTFNKELYLGLDASGSFKINDGMSFDLGLYLDHYNYQSGFEQTRDLVSFNPAILVNNGDGLNLDLGLGIAFGSDSISNGTKSYFYPDISASYQLGNQLLVFLDATGGVNVTNLNDLRLQNRYLEDSLGMLNEHTKVDIKAGIQYALRPDLVIEPYVGYQLVSNKQFFYPSASDTSRYSIVYEKGNFIQTSLGLSLRYVNNKSELIAKMYLQSYQTDSLSEAWFLPTTGLDVRYTQQFTEELSLNAGLVILQGLKGPSSLDGSVTDLPTVVDLSIGAGYKLTDKFSAFASVNNLLNIEYERYLNYPVRGIAGKIGFIYRF
ncbi:MAG: hypothetical protein RIC35_13470 [Marinoscillum sp.]